LLGQLDRIIDGIGTAFAANPDPEGDPCEDTTMPDWRERLRCSQCGSRNIDMVVSGARR
jgi:hypothetical protein